MPGVCILTSDFSFLGCKGGAGGIQKVYLTEWANLTGVGSTFTQASGVITAWTLATGKKFRTYALDQEIGSFTDPLKYTDESGAIIYEPSIEFSIKGISNTLNQEIHLIAKNYLCMIVLDDNGIYWVFGYDKPMHLVSVGRDSGTKFEDFNGNKLSFKGKDLIPIYQLTGSLITVLTT